jgi:Tfp pilus assembly protein PilF
MTGLKGTSSVRVPWGISLSQTKRFAYLAILLTAMVVAACPVHAQYIDPSLDPLLKDAVKYHHQGNSKKAIEIYTEYIVKGKGGKSAEAFNWRGMAYVDIGDLDKAVQDFNQAISLNAKYADPHNNRGEVFRKKKNFPEAVKNYQQAIALEPSFAEPNYNIGLILRMEGKQPEALKHYLAFVKKSSSPEDREDALKTIQQLLNEKDAPPKPGDQPPRAAAGPAQPDQKPAQDAAKPPPPGPQPPPPVAGQPPKAQQPAQPPAPKFTIFGFDVLGFLGFGSAPAPQAKPPQGAAPKVVIPGLDISPDDLMGETFGLVGTIINLVLYLVFSVFLFFIAKKTNTELPWLAFVPIANLYTFVRCAGKAWWWMLLFLIPLVNLVAYIIVCLGIARQRSKSGLWGVLLIIPCTAPIAMGYLALSD